MFTADLAGLRSWESGSRCVFPGSPVSDAVTAPPLNFLSPSPVPPWSSMLSGVQVLQLEAGMGCGSLLTFSLTSISRQLLPTLQD